jgi:hypothetical protein
VRPPSSACFGGTSVAVLCQEPVMVVALEVGPDGGAKQRLAPKGALKPIEQSAGETRVLITPVTDKDRSAHRPTTRWSWSPQLFRAAKLCRFRRCSSKFFEDRPLLEGSCASIPTFNFGSTVPGSGGPTNTAMDCFGDTSPNGRFPKRYPGTAQ